MGWGGRAERITMKSCGVIMETEAKSWAGRYRRLLIRLTVAVLLVAVVVVVFVPSLVAPWSRLHNEEQEIDLYSGRARVTRYFLYRQVGQDVHETPLSEAIAKNGRPDSGEKWVMVNIFQPGVRHSPHFRYHGAFGEANTLAKLWESYDCDAEARAKSGRQLLRAMREGGSYFVGGDYLHLLRETLGPDPVEGPAVAASRIPDDLVDRVLAKRAAEKQQH